MLSFPFLLETSQVQLLANENLCTMSTMFLHTNLIVLILATNSVNSVVSAENLSSFVSVS